MPPDTDEASHRRFLYGLIVSMLLIALVGALIAYGTHSWLRRHQPPVAALSSSSVSSPSAPAVTPVMSARSQTVQPSGLPSSQPTAAVAPTVAATASSLPPVAPGQGELGVEVQVDQHNELIAGAYRATKGILIVVDFKNESSVSHTLMLSTGQTLTAGPGQAVRLPRFPLEQPVTYRVSGFTNTGSITPE